jgi:predicted transcriptional regulator
MKGAARYKAISVTVPVEMEQALQEVCRKEIRKRSEIVQEALRMYFRARSGRVESLPLVMPDAADERAQTDLSAFAAEWGSPLDRVYDGLGAR